MTANYKRFRDLAKAMGENVEGLSDVSAAERAVEAAIRLSKDLNIPANFTSIGPYTKSRMGTGRYAEIGSTKISADNLERDVDRITTHVLGDASTPGNGRECTYDSVAPVVRHSLVGSY
jgi:methanol:N,N-dimethyl-4-nitrosoaniline oxidoreductase